MSELPAHVETTTETTTKHRCRICGSRLILGDATARRPGTEHAVDEWLERHRHDQGPPP